MRLVESAQRYIYSSEEDAANARSRWFAMGGHMAHMVTLEEEGSGLFSVCVVDCKQRSPCGNYCLPIGYLTDY